MKPGRTSLLSVAILAATVTLGALGWVLYQSHARGSDDVGNRPQSPAPKLTRFSNYPIQPIQQSLDLDADKVALGDKLFHDRRFSANNTISCASCHNLSAGGDDGRPTSVGINGAVGDSNSPTVFNAALNITQFWNGRVETLEQQIHGPIHHPKELGADWPQIIKKLQSDTAYLSTFNDIYEEGITSANVIDAIVTFERSLVTPDSPFDRYLLGDEDAISDNVKIGYEKFKEFGCIACHQGANVGGNIYQRIGVMADYFADRGTEITQNDLGRFNVTGKEEDKYVFRVPSLRLAPLTAPYFHDGSAATLQDAVRAMIKYQVGRTASAQDVELIVEFINSLVGEYKGKRLSL